MIVNFLYKMDEKNKRVITGMIVDDNHIDYDPLRQVDLILEDQSTPALDQKVISNYGTQYYGFINGDKCEYLNVNDYMLTVKVKLTNKICFATTVSKEMIDELTKQCSNFNEEHALRAVEAGYELLQNGSYKDSLGVFFRKVTDNVYCQLMIGKKPLYIGKEDYEYLITDDFKNASRVMKDDVRPLLVVKGWVSKSTDKKTLAFSKFNVFSDGISYGFAGENSFKVSFAENVLSITKDFTPDNTFRLVNDEKRSELLKDICYGFKREKKESIKLIEIGNQYACAIEDFTLKFLTNAALATPYDLRDIDILSAAYYLFNEDAVFNRVDPTEYYCYFKEGNEYQLTNEVLDYRSRPITKDSFLAFKENFKNMPKEEGVLLTSVDKYIKLITIKDTSFSLEFVDSGFHATIFSVAQANLITYLLGASFKRIELKPIFTAATDCQITNSPTKSLKEKYDEVLKAIDKSSIKLNPFPILDEIKTASEKNAFEYLKCLYPKCVMDAYGIFNLILKTSPEVENILIVGGSSSCDLQGLAFACEKQSKNVNVWTSEMTKWGYSPSCELGDRISIKNRYRLPFSSFPNCFMQQFDLIYFGKSYNEDPALVHKMLVDLKNCNKKVYLANTSLCEIGDFPNSFYQAVVMECEVNRKYNNLKLEDYNLDNVAMDVVSYDSPMISNKISYQNILKIDHGRIIDLFKKRQ